MIETHGKLLIASFLTLLIGLVLIQPLADDIEKVSTGSLNVGNETLNFASVTGSIVNETVTLNVTANSTARAIGQLANDQILAISSIINGTNTGGLEIRGFCNITDADFTPAIHGHLSCNGTGNLSLTINYTFISRRTVTLVHDDILSITTLSNVTSENIRGYCNATLATGAIVCNNTKNATGFAAYDYDPDNTIDDASTQTITRLSRLFFAIAILVISMGFAIAAFKQSGVM